jgi:predicted nicotinamide N-methyase
MEEYIKPRLKRLDPKEMTRAELNWKRNNLLEHLKLLEENFVGTAVEIEKMENNYEINPQKKIDLVMAIDVMGREIEEVKEELRELDRCS